MWGQRQINGDSIKMFIINTWEWSLCPTFSSCIKQGKKNWCNPKEVILVLLGGIPLHIMYTQNVDSMVCTSAPQNFICSTLNRTLLLPLVRFVLMWEKTKIMKLQILKHQKDSPALWCIWGCINLVHRPPCPLETVSCRVNTRAKNCCALSCHSRLWQNLSLFLISSF